MQLAAVLGKKQTMDLYMRDVFSLETAGSENETRIPLKWRNQRMDGARR